MKKIHLLTATAGILLALAGPTLAAQRTHGGYDSYASTSDRSGAYNYGPNGQSYVTQDRAFAQPQAQYSRGNNLPYADRPYGDPDRW
jgi:hypothetical protein